MSVTLRDALWQFAAALCDCGCPETAYRARLTEILYAHQATGLADHRISNARHGQVACYCSALDWMTLDQYGEHIETVAAAPDGGDR